MKKILPILLLMVFILTACGGKSEPENVDVPDIDGTTPIEAPETGIVVHHPPEVEKNAAATRLNDVGGMISYNIDEHLAKQIESVVNVYDFDEQLTNYILDQNLFYNGENVPLAYSVGVIELTSDGDFTEHFDGWYEFSFDMTTQDHIVCKVNGDSYEFEVY